MAVDWNIKDWGNRVHEAANGSWHTSTEKEDES